MNPLHLHREDLPPGVVGPEWRYGPVSLTDIVRYAGASGDFTPLHHDFAVAEKLGLDRVFAMGMMAAGFLGHYAADWLGVSRIRRFAVRFRDKTWIGDVLIFRGTVVGDPATLGMEVAQVSLDVSTATGRVLITGQAEADVPPLSSCPECRPRAGLT